MSPGHIGGDGGLVSFAVGPPVNAGASWPRHLRPLLFRAYRRTRLYFRRGAMASCNRRSRTLNQVRPSISPTTRSVFFPSSASSFFAQGFCGIADLTRWQTGLFAYALTDSSETMERPRYLSKASARLTAKSFNARPVAAPRPPQDLTRLLERLIIPFDIQSVRRYCLTV